MNSKSKTEPLKGAPAEVLDAFNRLNDKRKAFALALPTAESDVEAARLADYSEKTAKAMAFKLAKDPNVVLVVDYLRTGVQTGVQEADAEAIAEASATLKSTVQELCRITELDPRALYDDNGRLLPMKDWPADAARAVASIESYEEYEGRGADRVAVGIVRKVKFHPKIEGINTLSRIKGWNKPDRLELDATDPVKKLIAEVASRGSSLPVVSDP